MTRKKGFSIVGNKFSSVIIKYKNIWTRMGALVWVCNKMIFQNQIKLLFTNLTWVWTGYLECKLSKHGILKCICLRTGAKRQKLSSLVIIVGLIQRIDYNSKARAIKRLFSSNAQISRYSWVIYGKKINVFKNSLPILNWN